MRLQFMMRVALFAMVGIVLGRSATAVAGGDDPGFLVNFVPSIGTSRMQIGFGINGEGAVVGIASSQLGNPSAFAPWLWEGGPAPIGIGPPLGTYDFLDAARINDDGLIIGTLYVPSGGPPTVGLGVPVPVGTTRAVVFESPGVVNMIPGLGSILGEVERSNGASGLNDFGDIVGASIDGGDGPFSGIRRAFLYDRSGQLHDLSGIAGAGFRATDAVDINDSGQICGHAVAGGLTYAFRHDPQLGLRLQGPPAPGESLVVRAMNDLGQVVGIIRNKQFEFVAGFLWDGTTLQRLGPYRPLDINNHGEIVGWATTDIPDGPFGFERHAVWFDGAKWHDLDVRIGTPPFSWFGQAVAINDAGQILLRQEYTFQTVLVTDNALVLTPGVPPLGDVDLNGFVDPIDFSAMYSCFSGPAGLRPTSCHGRQDEYSDLDDDGDVDLADLWVMQRLMEVQPVD